MFTGIIEEIGLINKISKQDSGKRFKIQAHKILEDLKIDQSVAVNGVCLTVVDIGSEFFSADAVAETLKKSTLRQSKKDESVNLERALKLQDRLGGHIVQGHVDGIGVIKDLEKKPGGSILLIEIPVELNKYCILEGSISIDGVSLTIAKKEKNILTLALIPHTMTNTIFQYKKVSDLVNIEVDFFAKYVEQFLDKTRETKITSEWLKQQGF